MVGPHERIRAYLAVADAYRAGEPRDLADPEALTWLLLRTLGEMFSSNVEMACRWLNEQASYAQAEADMLG